MSGPAQARRQARRARTAHRLRLQGSRAAARGADARQRARRQEEAPRLRPARVSRRPRAWACASPSACSPNTRTNRKANWRRATMRWSTATPAPAPRARRIWATRVVLSPSEEANGGRSKEAILGDICESVIAALYLDGGLETARAFITRFWGDAFEDVEERAARRQDGAAGMGGGAEEAVCATS